MNVYYGIVANTTIWINCEYLAIDFGFDLIFFVKHLIKSKDYVYVNLSSYRI